MVIDGGVMAGFSGRMVRRWGRVPFPVVALAVCLLFAVAGVLAVADYGIGSDELTHRNNANATVDYIMGDGDDLPTDVNRFYGVVIELPQLLVERVLNLQDSRRIFLTRHLLTRLFFIVGGFFCGLLAWRMFGSRWAGLLAMLLFMLHPRLYAHSFINNKDIPFLVMFIIALYLTHRAFRKDTLGAFALLGIVVGLAVNVRPFALLLPLLILTMRGLDWGLASGPRRRKNILLTGGIFAAAIPVAIYISNPYYWENPLRFIEGLRVFSQHPNLVVNLFQGQSILSDAVPPHFIPVWFGITAPLAALLLGIVGAAGVCWQGLRWPGRILRPGELRFLFLVLGCFVLPVVAVIALQSNIYSGWRHLYFLWAPFCLLAAAAVAPRARACFRVRRIAVYGLALASVAGAVYAIVSLHPHQQVYFNLLVNRAGPDELGRQYEMDYWETSQLQGLNYLLERYPDGALYVLDIPATFRNWMIPTAAERERIVLSDGWSADFHIMADRNRSLRETALEPVIYERRAYGSAYLTITAPRLVWGAGLQPGADVYRAAYQAVSAAGGPAARSIFEVYISDGVLYYVKDNCARADVEKAFSLHLIPVDADDLPAERREYGFDNRDFYFVWRGGFFDGKCITQVRLPDYPIDRIRTGQYDSRGATVWRAEINPFLFTQFREIEAGLAGSRPVGGGPFEIYRKDGRVIYYSDACVAGDTAARFFLHLYPTDASNLPVERREYGFDNRDFYFGEYGAHRGGKCLAAVALPDYAIELIRTGQFVAGGGRLWTAELAGGE